MLIRFLIPTCFLMMIACAKSNPVGTSVGTIAPPVIPLHQNVEGLGSGLQFFNDPVTGEAKHPEDGARYIYPRKYSANSRNSPVGIEIWLFNEEGQPIHGTVQTKLVTLYQEIYRWNPDEWESQLAGVENATAILREKSDFFWESLAQQMAERVFNEAITPPLYRFGPHCIDEQSEGCKDEGIPQASRVVVRTFLDARRDPTNPVTRSITYSAKRGHVAKPELIFELQVPNGLTIAGPHQETLDFRPSIGGETDAVQDIRIWAHVPSDAAHRITNFDYPDYNLVFVPLRHLALQGDVDDPKVPSSAFAYSDRTHFIASIGTLLEQMRTPEGGSVIADRLGPFLSQKYYYMFESGGQGLNNYRSYILGDTAGVARGLNPDFGRIEVMMDGQIEASF